jgi:hypothetical protein
MWSFSLFISSAWMLLVADLCTLNAVLNRNLKVICVTRGFNESLGQAVKRSIRKIKRSEIRTRNWTSRHILCHAIDFCSQYFNFILGSSIQIAAGLPEQFAHSIYLCLLTL